jgi:hypothetical protein
MVADAESVTPEEQQKYSEAFTRQQQQTRTFRAELRQTVMLRGLKEPVTSQGWLYYQSPDSLLLKFDQPAGEFVLLRGSDLHQQKTNKPLMHRKLSEQEKECGAGPGFLLSLFQNGGTNYYHLFSVHMARTNEALLVTLAPRKRNSKERLGQIENIIALPSLEIRSIRLQLGPAGSATYEFVNPTRNEPLDPALFAAPKP